MIKLIVTDMDGTLLDDQGRFPEGFSTFLQEMKQRGIRFVVASGRQYPGLKKQFQEYLEDVAIIAENGAFVVWNEKELFVKKMTKEQLHIALEGTKQVTGAKPMICAKYYSYMDDAAFCEELRGAYFRYEMRHAEDLYGLDDDTILRMAVLNIPTEKLPWAYATLRPLLPEEISLTISGKHCMDVGLTGVNKGTAVQALQEIWNITPEETMVFGDQQNDLEMMACATYSYAMANASEVVKEQANFIAEDNNHAGVLRAVWDQLKQEEESR